MSYRRQISKQAAMLGVGLLVAFGERGIGASNVDRTVGNMFTEIPNAVCFFSKTTKSCCISLINP